MTFSPAKTALVTGAAKRIGRAIALALAQRGWDVIVHYGHSRTDALDTVREIQALGRRAVALACDLANEEEARNLFQRCVAELGPVSCLVNNASLFENDGVADISQPRLDIHMHTNLLAPIVLANALYQATPDGSQSVVVNLLDQKLFNLNPDFLSYTLSKVALESATTMLAQALAPRVRVVGIAPGITLISGAQTPQGFARAHALTPLGRSSTPDDIAAAVCFVAESPAITGTTLVVDGGQHLVPTLRDVMFVAK